ncbi:MAG: hypothetical protein ACFCBW_02910 [Candidatus Competibacterales bacterium]
MRPTKAGIPILETEVEQRVALPAESDELTKRLSLDLPESLHRRFKTACSGANGGKMISEMLAFVEARTAELEEKAGIYRK